MIIEQHQAPEQDRIRPLVSLSDIVSGPEFQDISDALEEIRTHKRDSEVIHKNCLEIVKSLRICFGIDCTVSVLDPVDNLIFYGYNIFPQMSSVRKIIDAINDKQIDQIHSIWQTTKKWHIEIDGHMLYDISNHLNAKEMATILMYVIDQVIFDYNTPIRIAYTLMKYQSKMNFVTRYIMNSKKIRFIYAIPFLLGCAICNFTLGNQKKLETFRMNNIVSSTPDSNQRYFNAVWKIFQAYGRGELIDQSQAEMDHRILCIMDWIYEGMNDLRYSSLRLIENLRRAMRTCRSPYVRLVFKQMILMLSAPAKQLDADPDNRAMTESTYVNPEMKAMQERLITDYWTNYVTAQESEFFDRIIGKNGRVKRITRDDLDLLRVECENISSVDDKIYLLERLHHMIGELQVLREMIEEKSKYKINQSKNEIDNLLRYADSIRLYIMNYKIRPEQYGLYIKYPAGYEG